MSVRLSDKKKKKKRFRELTKHFLININRVDHESYSLESKIIRLQFILTKNTLDDNLSFIYIEEKIKKGGYYYQTYFKTKFIS